MKITLTILILSILINLQSQNRWETIIGETEIDDFLFDKEISYDEGFILGNWKTDDRELIKTDKNGVELWRKTIMHSSSPLYFSKVLQTEDQLLLGGGKSNNPLIVSLNHCFDVNWCVEFINDDYESGFIQDITIFNNQIIALTYLNPVDQNNRTDRVFLFSFDFEGNFLWKKVYASRDNYPEMDFPYGNYLQNFGNYLIISGYCYYPFPNNPNVMGRRPLFIRIDSLYNEEWVLPFGVDEDLIGLAGGVIEKDIQGNNISVGQYNGPLSYSDKTGIMEFNQLGERTGLHLIPNEQIGSNIVSNYSIDIIDLPNEGYILISNFGPQESDNPWGELQLDSSYNVINSKYILTSVSNVTRIKKASDSTFLFGLNISENPPVVYERDIMLYELYPDLSQVGRDTSFTEYDYLCENLPILSDTILLEDCSLITNIEDTEPYKYLANNRKIEFDLSPNPAIDIIHIQSDNIENSTVNVCCFDISGKIVYQDSFYGNNFYINISRFQIGMYSINLSDDLGRFGSHKFIKN